MFRELSEAARHTAAKATLAGLMTWLGEAGLLAAASAPALLALVDQHAASVRDGLGDPENGPSAIGLASYATGVRDTVTEYGWRLPGPSEVDSIAMDWPLARMLAVCSLARANGYA